jgi:putative ABC transport system permease protein
MSLSLAYRLARRELRGGIKGFRVFLTCLALGVAAIAAVGTVRQSIDDGLKRESATLLGGDVEIELTYRFATETELAFLDANASAVSAVVDFRSMVAAGDQRGLTQIKAVDAAYPLLGQPKLTPDIDLSTALQGSKGLPGAVMDPVLIERLGIQVGDTFKLGDAQFRLMAGLIRESDSTTGGFTLGPRTIVLAKDLANSGLLQPGTLFDTKYRLLLPKDVPLAQLKARTEVAFEQSGFRWRDVTNGVRGVERFVERLSAFLVLTGLAGLAVGGVGIATSVTSYLTEKRAVIATLKTLGAEGRTIFQVYALQIAALAGLGIVVGLVIGAVAPLIALPLLAQALPVPIDVGIKFAPLAQAALYGTLATALFTLWPLAQSEQVRAAALYRDAALGFRAWPRRRYIVATGLIFVALVGSAAYLTNAARLTLAAAGGLTGAFLILLIATWATRSLAKRLSRSKALRGHTAFRLALGAIGGPGGKDASAVILSLGLGLSVLAAVGQIDSNLRNAITRELPKVAPSFFVVDIQADQMDGFLKRLKGDPGVSKVESAPMLRGVITELKGRPAAEVAGKHWVIEGDRGLTFSDQPSEGTNITAGEWWPSGYSGEPLVSFAAEEGEEMGLKLGDAITVNILGRDIKAHISSFRTVDFSNAGMGFVMSINPAAIAGAPYSSIATIYADEGSESAIMRDISTAYPNITLISVKEAIGRVSEVLTAIAGAITYGALATLLTGGVVLIGAAAAGERSRTFEAAVLKTLGSPRGPILWNFALRSLILGAAAGIVAVIAGALSGWTVSRFVMDVQYHFEAGSAVFIVLGGILVTTLAGLGFAWRPLRARPAQVLRSKE